MNIKKIMAAVSAMAVAAAMNVSMLGVCAAEEDTASLPELKIGEVTEAESLVGADDVWKEGIYTDKLPGYSGEGFIYMTNKPYAFKVDAPKDGMYDLSIRYVQILGKGESRQGSFEVNGIKYTTQFAYATEWTDKNVAKIRLHKGENTIKLTNEYGYSAYDTITIKEAEFPSLDIADDTPCDPDATPETRSLMKFLKSVYGKNILSGQQTIYGGGHGVNTTIHYDAQADKCVDQDGNEYTFTAEDKGEYNNETVVWHCTGKDGQVYSYDTQNRGYKYNEYDRELKYIKETTGDMPAIQGFDFGANCPCYQWDDGVVERMIDWTVNKNGICTASWHINVPNDMSTYKLGEPVEFALTSYNATNNSFLPSKAITKGTPEYDYWELCKKNLAEQLLKLQEAGVPVIFRPLHEAEGNPGTKPGDGTGSWFWWGREGAKVYNDLWKNLYTTLTEEYGIHNLLWEQNLYAWSAEDSALWYTGDEWVDIVGFDKYNTQYNRHDGKTSGPNLDAESGIFWTLYNEVKGKKMVAMPENDSIPSLDNLTIENAAWLYFCPWYDEESSPKFLSGEEYQDFDEYKKLYQSDYCLTLSELPEWRTGGSAEPAPTIDFIPGDVTGDKKVNAADFLAMKNTLIKSKDLDGMPAPHAFAADVTGDGVLNVDDAVTLAKFLTGQKVKLTYYKGK